MGTSENTKTALNEEQQVGLFAIQLSYTSILPIILKTAIELDLFEVIVKAGEGVYLSPKEIAAQIPTTNPEAAVMLDRIMRVLASYSVLKCKVRESEEGVEERLYGVELVCKYFTKNVDGVSMAPFVLLTQDKVLMESWYKLKDAVLEGGIPFNKTYGMSAFEYQGTDPRFNKAFNQAMSNQSTFVMKKILETYAGFKGISSLVDIGGGNGTTLNMIIAKYPSIKGINFDLPHVIEDAPTLLGVEHVGGDMFLSIPKADAIFMKFVCHDWSDIHCLKLLKNCYDALPQNGKVIIVESLLPLFPDTSLETKRVVNLDVAMLAHYAGGKERTEKEFEALAKSVGFAGFQVMCPANIFKVMEFLKNV